MTILFEFNNVKYQDVLDIKHLIIYEKKTTVFLGTSGGGKTTILKCLNKMISPDHGIIHYKGKRLEDLKSVDHRKKVIMLQQKPFLFPKTILDNFLALEKIQNISINKHQITKVLKDVGLSKPLDFDVEKLSGGEAQRLALARIMLSSADVILLDEPSSALDEKLEQMIIEKIKTFVIEKNKTLIMVTHSKDIALKHADDIYYIEGGKLEEKANE
mgnify:CR=1 FL=1